MIDTPAAKPDSDAFRPLSIATLNRLVRERLETGFPLCWVTGEISNLTIAASGHAYFTLKDAHAQVRAVMFRNRNALLGFRPTNGQRVEARVLVTLYEARGDFQLNVEAMRLAGTGDLFERFLRLKARLEAEGLFASERKKPLPAFPRRIGIVTSLQAAALRDVLTTLGRRSPQVEAIVFPTPVQGEGAAEQIAAAIETAAHWNCDALLVCRGGGSMEDLWAFNEEVVARAIAASPLPVISGVGHETDFTIADFAADLRAPTPTAAAEIVAPEREYLNRQLITFSTATRRQMRRTLEQCGQRIDWLARRLTHPAERIRQQRAELRRIGIQLHNARQQQQTVRELQLVRLRQRLLARRPASEIASRRVSELATRLSHLWETQRAKDRATLDRLGASLSHLAPQAVLGRGYALVRDDLGAIVRDASRMEPSAAIHVYLARGRMDAVVTGVDLDGRFDAHTPPGTAEKH